MWSQILHTLTVKAELRERLLNWIQHAEGTRPTITD